jgi:hypothetical protein
MTDMNDSDNTTCTDTSQDLHVMNSIPDSDTHNYEKVNQTHLLSVRGCTAHELTFKCQNEGCSQEANPVLTQGDLPVTSEEVDDLAYNLYCWFYDNSDEIPPFTDNSALYIAPFMMIPGEGADPVLLFSRISLLIAADLGNRDGTQDQDPKQKDELLITAKRHAHNVVQSIEDTQGSILKMFE